MLKVWPLCPRGAGKLGKEVCFMLYKIEGWACSSVVEQLASVQEALNLSPCTGRREMQRKKKEEEEEEEEFG